MKVEEIVLETEEESLRRQTNGRLKILVIEADPEWRHLLCDYFAKQGHQVVCAKSAFEGLWKAKGEQPNIVFLAYLLGDVTGATVLKCLKQESPTIKVIVVSAAEEPEIQVGMFSLGADGYYRKDQTSLADLGRCVESLPLDRAA